LTAPINVALQGYLDFFGLKNGGRNPQVPAEYLQPTMDLEQWYAESRNIDYFWGANPIAVNTGVSNITPTTVSPVLTVATGFVVPSTELWILLPGSDLRMTYDDPAQSAEGGYQVVVNASGAGYNLPMREQGFALSPSPVGINTVHVMTIDEPQFIHPGSELQPITWGVVVGGGTVSFGGTLRLVRLRV